MPRQLQKKRIEVFANGKSITVSMFPPNGRDKTWYVYWKGLPTRKSTHCRNYDDAVQAVNDMLNNNGRRSIAEDAILNDEDFDRIQRQHFDKKKDPKAQRRAQKSLAACMEAITAFRMISGLKPITFATADDCERFQRRAVELPKNWRSTHPNSQKQVEPLSPNTVVKWSVALRAAFERANRNAGRKCVRGVVEEHLLLKENPWDRFTWIEGRESTIRQYDGNELLSLLDYLEAQWPGLAVPKLVAKTLLWSWGRKSEVMALRWSEMRKVGSEIHFESVGKWGVDKWFRIPESLFRQFQEIKTDSPFVFAVHNDQLRQFHRNGPRPWLASKVGDDFKPENLGDWFYDRVKEWSEVERVESAYIHIFRKTSLQYARSGEDANQNVADDARVSVGVMMKHYAKETDNEMRQKSNRTYQRIVASLPPDVALRYGYAVSPYEVLRRELEGAISGEDWVLAARLISELAKLGENP